MNGNTYAQIFTDTKIIILHTSKSKAEAGNFLKELIDDVEIPMNMRFDHSAEFLGEVTEFTKSIKKHSINWNVTEHYSHCHNQSEDGIKRIELRWKSTMQRKGYSPRL